MNDSLSRRQLLVQLAHLAGLGVAIACGSRARPAMLDTKNTGDGRLRLRERRTLDSGPTGTTPLGLGRPRDGVMIVPSRIVPGRLYPLVLLLHGAGGSSAAVGSAFGHFAEELPCILLVPESREATWDLIRGGYGEDVRFIQRALDRALDLYPVDIRRIRIAGFSDGASYALALGITNGDIFSRVAAFSPGLMRVESPHGSPAFFVSHGRDDRVLPIDRASRRLVPTLRGRGYTVEYREFDGGHQVPTDVRQYAMAWLASDGRSPAPPR